ncbi:MAG: ABC transporter ATP-binding protein [Oenococcus sp.]|uniref:ABC transporter ATP-binding protein n=1 Tax=Oenococcus TaxID=46254 RepID=UPI0021E71A4C|nr:ABC transporter ATP-binding protein [Oenococcus kitaharae]MCV3296741.1 ABC transporter ATP-binding protein [Oenococcus kitaharae]
MILDIQQLSLSFKQKSIFKQTALSISQPGIYGLVAPNGSGKTTLLNLIANLLVPDAGSISLFDKPDNQQRFFQSASFLQDNTVLYDYLTAYDHLKLICQLRQIPLSQITKIAELLDMTDYLTQKKVSAFSLGMKQRLLLAMALIADTPLVLLDEPLNGLDPTSLQIIRKTLLAMKEHGKTLLVSSHNLDELDKVTRKIFFIKNQQIFYKELSSNESSEAVYEKLYMSQP